MNWKEEVFRNFKLYAVTDLKPQDVSTILAKVEAAYRGGADIVQLRSQSLSDGLLYSLGKEMRVLADRFHKLFFVNDRPDLALAVEADGVHVGQADMPVSAIRKLANIKQPFWIGKSTHSIIEGREALKDKPDYIGVGPVYNTPTKPGYKPAGLVYVKQAADELEIPFVAIGGIDQSNINEVLEAGARRVAVVRAIFAAENVFEATHKLRQEIESHQYV